MILVVRAGHISLAGFHVEVFGQHRAAFLTYLVNAYPADLVLAEPLGWYWHPLPPELI